MIIDVSQRVIVVEHDSISNLFKSELQVVYLNVSDSRELDRVFST